MKLGLVDDHPLFLNGLALLLESSGFNVILKAANGKEMCLLLKDRSTSELPDIIITDINMPEMDGYETITWLKENHSDIKIVALSHSCKTEVVFKSLSLGANCFLNKDIYPNDLINAIQKVFDQGEYLTKAVTAMLINNLNSKKTADSKYMIDNLTAREKEIIRLITKEYTSSQIALQLGITIRTVEGHIQNITSKLQVKSRVGIAVFALSNSI